MRFGYFLVEGRSDPLGDRNPDVLIQLKQVATAIGRNFHNQFQQSDGWGIDGEEAGAIEAFQQYDCSSLPQVVQIQGGYDGELFAPVGYKRAWHHHQYRRSWVAHLFAIDLHLERAE